MAKVPSVVRILDVLKPEAVTVDIKATDKVGVLKEMVGLLFPQQTPEVREEILQALLEREKLGSTGIGSGVAVPHAKSERANSITCAFGVVKKGLDFQALDQAPVHLVFLLVAPPSFQSEHLNILARIVRLLKDRVFRQALREAKTVQEVTRLISEEDL